jgi:hypothetical protein
MVYFHSLLCFEGLGVLAARAVQEFLWKSPEANSESRWNVVTSLFGIAGQKRNTMPISQSISCTCPL